MKDEMKTNPSCDFISRTDAIEAIANAEPKDNEYHYYKHFAIKILSEIPSAEVVSFEDAMQIRNTILFKEYMRGRRDAEVEQGEWICKGDYAICSKCGGSSGTQFDGVERTPRTTTFCPHCGVKMTKGDDSE